METGRTDGRDASLVKILLVHNHYRSEEPSGEDRVFAQEAAALADAGHAVERFERFSDDIARRSLAGRAVVPAQVVWSNGARRSLTQSLRDWRPDVVHVHNTFPLISPSALYACRDAQVPVVATIHNYRLVCASGALFRDGAVCHDCVGRIPVAAVRHGCYRDSTLATLPMAASQIVHRRAWRTLVSAYVFLSGIQRDIVAADGFPPGRLFVKPNFVHPGVAAPTGTEDLIVYAGRLAPVKGLGILMAAWDGYVAQRASPRVHLAIAGAGPLQDEVAAWAATRASVDYLGALSGPDCALLLGRGRAAVVPSTWEETFGLVAVEAMAAGVPPIASALGSFPELITDGVDGVLFEAGNASALAEAFCDVELNPERYKALGRAAQRTFERRFTSEVNLDQLMRVYRFAIQHPAWQPLGDDVPDSMTTT